MLGILAAFPEEVQGYLRRGRFRATAHDGFLRFHQSALEPEVVVVGGGVGRARAQAATRRLIESYGPAFILSAGFAGGAQPGLKTGDLFICDRLMAAEDYAAPWQPDSVKQRAAGNGALVAEVLADRQAGALSYAICACLSAPQLVSDSSMKARIGSSLGVALIDMEAYWVSETAAIYGVPHAVARVVFDPMEQTLPSFVGEVVSDGGRRKWARAAKQVVTRPAETPRLIQLAKQARVARASLSAFLNALAPKLAHLPVAAAD